MAQPSDAASQPSRRKSLRLSLKGTPSSPTHRYSPSPSRGGRANTQFSLTDSGSLNAELFLRAVRKGDLQTVRNFVNLDPHRRHADTCLINTARVDNVDLCDDFSDEDEGSTALILAAYYGDAAMCSFLLDSHANPLLGVRVGRKEYGAAYWAAHKGHAAAFRVIMEKLDITNEATQKELLAADSAAKRLNVLQDGVVSEEKAEAKRALEEMLREVCPRIREQQRAAKYKQFWNRLKVCSGHNLCLILFDLLA